MVISSGFLLLSLISLFICAGLVVHGTFSKNNFGVNFRMLHGAVKCPGCGYEIRTTSRKPKDMQEALWGGFSCENCERKYDKWGQPRNKK